MKTTFGGKMARQTKTMSQPESSPGQNVISLSPPDYGIDFVDRNLAASSQETIQTKTANGLQSKGGDEGFRLDDDTASRINRARGGGRPLGSDLQEQMSEAMGYDFSGVRVHTDAQANALNQQLSANAFTAGQDIFFRRGAYEPGSSRGRELVAHELSHVVQQSTGCVQGGGSGVTVRSAGDRFEQEAMSAARLLMTHYGAKNPDWNHRSAGQNTNDRTTHRIMRQLHHIDRGDGRTAQRHCWEMTAEQVASFEGGVFEHHEEPDNADRVYFRMQEDPDLTISSYFAPALEGEPDVWRVAEDGVVTQDERNLLAVSHNWVDEWNCLVLYENVTSPAGRKAYWGFTATQEDESGVYQGGAIQAVFPPRRTARIMYIVPVVEQP